MGIYRGGGVSYRETREISEEENHHMSERMISQKDVADIKAILGYKLFVTLAQTSIDSEKLKKMIRDDIRTIGKLLYRDYKRLHSMERAVESVIDLIKMFDIGKLTFENEIAEESSNISTIKSAIKEKPLSQEIPLTMEGYEDYKFDELTPEQIQQIADFQNQTSKKDYDADAELKKAMAQREPLPWANEEE
jgi:hypothetical protein